jgi:hypothetical protein
MEELMTTDACTLPTVERPFRLAELDALFTDSARSVTRDERGVRIHLEGDSTLGDRVRDLAERETACCSFFTFAIEGTPDAVVLDIAVPQNRREILDALADRAQELIR